MNEREIDIFNSYIPEELKSSELKDSRFYKIRAWSSEKLNLKFPQFYSKDLLDILKHYLKAAIEYLEGNYLSEVTIRYKLSVRVTKRVAQEIIVGVSMEKILRSLIGNQGKIGLELAIADLKIFFHINKRMPYSSEDEMVNIRNSVFSSKHWRKFGIKTWNDLLIQAFGEEKLRDLKKSEEQKNFNKVVSELKKWYDIKGRLPLYSDKEIKWIAGSVTNGIWKRFGIKTWNDLLMRVFGETNLVHNLYNGIEGLNKAVNELLDFYNNNRKLPTIRECGIIAGAVHRGVWKEFGIKKWNDMMNYVFREVNLNIENDFSKKDSLENAQKQLRDFRDKNERLPTSKDGKMSSIWKVAKRGVWKDLGIESWNDIFKITFGVAAIERYKYVGKKGFERAIKEIRVYKEEMGKNPSLPEMDSIYRIIKKGKWEQFGIICWNDILQEAIGEVNVERKYYKGKEGFEKAIQALKTFNEKTGKIPTTKNKGMWNINYAIRQGEWKEFGVTIWYDLLKIAFENIKIERNKYNGKTGLDNAIKALREFEKNSGRKPTSKDIGMKNIRNAVYRGVWEEFGVKYWNDLFKLAFGVKNIKRCKFSGREGLNRAAQELLNFQIKYNKRPTTKETKMSGIAAAIYRGLWKDLNIHTWRDLFNFAFNEEK